MLVLIIQGGMISLKRIVIDMETIKCKPVNDKSMLTATIMMCKGKNLWPNINVLIFSAQITIVGNAWDTCGQ